MAKENEAIKALFEKFKKPLRKPLYDRQQEWKNKAFNRVHLEDYPLFFSHIREASNHRLAERIKMLQDYPVPMPKLPSFPWCIKELSPAKIPPEPDLKPPQLRWYGYLFFWDAHKRLKAIRKENEAKKAKFELQKSEIEKFNEWLRKLRDERQREWNNKKEHFDKACQETMGQWEEANSAWEAGVTRDKEKFKQLCSQYEKGESLAVVSYFKAHLDSMPLPSWCPRKYELEFDKDESILLIEARLPYFEALKVIKTRKLKYEDKLVSANQREKREFSNQFPYLIAIRMIWEVVQVDYSNQVGMVCCNGYVIYDDPTTGRSRRDVILSVAAKKEDLQDIKLYRIEPEACFRNLKGVAAAIISELVPVQPLIRFNKEDKRFITAKEVLDKLGDSNLATMDWQDFEHLIRELFEKEFGSSGAEVRVTQASRDRGVDAVVFDPDPLKGGKYVIQAKRYTYTVDVSAVRDLYGTVLNEGANRGILVTTSNYGIDAHNFAKDKPLTLINGANLMHLLRKHGYSVKIDLKEAKRLLKTR